MGCGGPPCGGANPTPVIRTFRGIDAQVDADELRERPHQQSGAEQQNHRQRDLRDHQSAAHPRLTPPCSGAAADAGSHERVAPCALQGREHAKPHRCDRGGNGGKQQDRLIEPDLGLPRDTLARHEPRQRLNPRIREQAAGDQAAECEQRALDEQLPHDAGAARADGDANAELALADRGARQQHVRDVAARDDEQQAHGAEQRVEHAAEITHDPVDDGDDLESVVRRVILRVLGCAPRPDDVQLRLRRFRGDARPQVGLERAEAARRPRVAAALEVSRQPQVGDVPLESRRHDPDDRPRLAVEHHRPAEDAGIAGKEPDPRAVAHHRDARCARRRIAGIEGAADERGHTQERETVRGHPGHVEPLRPAIPDPERRVATGPDDVFEDGRGLFLVVEKLGGGEVRTANDAVRRVLEDNVHQSLGPRVRERVEDDVADDAVDHRHRADPQRERRDRDRGEAWRPHQCADAIDDVPAEVFNPLQERSTEGRHDRFLGRRLDDSTSRAARRTGTSSSLS